MAGARSYLFVTFEGGGNVPPVLGLARRLAARGHQVRVLTEPCLRSAVEEAGARFVLFTRHFTRDDRTVDLIGDSAARTPIGALGLTFQHVVFGPVTREENKTLRDLTPREIMAVVPVIVMIVWMGVYPQPFIDRIAIALASSGDLPAAISCSMRWSRWYWNSSSISCWMRLRCASDRSRSLS